MNDRDTILACIEEIERLQQDHPDVGATLVIWNLRQMLERASDRWTEGFHTGLGVRGGGA